MEKDPRQHGLRFLDGSSLESEGVHTPHLCESSLQVQFTYLNPMPRDVVMTTRYSINEDDIVLVLRGPAEASPNVSSASYVARGRK